MTDRVKREVMPVEDRPKPNPKSQGMTGSKLANDFCFIRHAAIAPS